MTDFMTVGDLARQLVARRQNADVRAQMDTLLKETGTGLRADLAESLQGDFTLLSGLEADLSRLDSYATAITELQGRGEALQRVLSSGRELVNDTMGQLLTASPPSNVEAAWVVTSEARGRFEDFAARLNGSFAGAALFAGTGTDAAAVAIGADMLAALETVISPLNTAEDVETAIRDWFAVGGDYDTSGYLGEVETIPGLQISPTRQIGLDVTAADLEIRETLTGLAMAALAGSSPLAGVLDEQGALMVSAAEQLSDAQGGLAQLQARIGAQEQELQRQESRNASERAALEASRAGLTDVDIFETATKLEAVQSQLELLYTITARSAQFSLVRFLQ